MATTTPTDADTWDDGSDYDLFMGRWSRLIAAHFVSELGIQPRQRWLDVGCGTGALLQCIIDLAEPSSVAGIDPSDHFVARALEMADGRADVKVGSGENLPFDDHTFDVVVSGIALNFMPDPVTTLKEWHRVAGPGATISVYVWDYAEGMEFLRTFWDTAVDLDPAAADLDEGIRFPLCRPEALSAVFTEAGLSTPNLGSIEVPTTFASFDDYWAPFTRGQGPAPGYVASLAPDDRRRLFERLRVALVPSDDGRIHLKARVWTATSVV